MDRNAFVGLMLILMIWLIWQADWARKHAPAPTAETAVAQSTTNPTAVTTAAAAKAPQALEAVPVSSTHQILENAVVRLQTSSQTGSFSEIVLKQYPESAKHEASPVNLVDKTASDHLPFELYLGSEEAPSAVMSGFREQSFSAETKEITYRWENTDHSLRVERVLRLEGDSYNVSQQIRLSNLSSQHAIETQVGQAWNAHTPPQKKTFGQGPSAMVWEASVLSSDDKLQKAKIKSGERDDRSGVFKWASLGNRYFLMAVFPGWQGGSRFNTTLVEEAGAQRLSGRLWTPQIRIEPNQTVSIDSRIFLGPKDLKVLETEGQNLTRSLDLGMFEFFALALLRLMQFFNQFLRNWGLSIIALTLVVKVVFYPLSYKSFKSMKEMQRIQPLINDLRERYKDDKEQLNIQMLKIMREHKVNPLGGCLPMVIQMPIYFALYRVFWGAIELRHAPFFLWIHDLSARDPYFITPVVLGGAMFLQQRMSPKPPDPVQAQMMNIMPIMFTFFMAFLPSGLVLYILCNTLLTILQQWYVNRSLDLRPLPVLAESK